MRRILHLIEFEIVCLQDNGGNENVSELFSESHGLLSKTIVGHSIKCCRVLQRWSIFSFIGLSSP